MREEKHSLYKNIQLIQYPQYAAPINASDDLITRELKICFARGNGLVSISNLLSDLAKRINDNFGYYFFSNDIPEKLMRDIVLPLEELKKHLVPTYSKNIRTQRISEGAYYIGSGIAFSINQEILISLIVRRLLDEGVIQLGANDKKLFDVLETLTDSQPITKAALERLCTGMKAEDKELLWRNICLRDLRLSKEDFGFEEPILYCMKLEQFKCKVTHKPQKHDKSESYTFSFSYNDKKRYDWLSWPNKLFYGQYMVQLLAVIKQYNIPILELFKCYREKIVAVAEKTVAESEFRGKLETREYRDIALQCAGLAESVLALDTLERHQAITTEELRIVFQIASHSFNCKYDLSQPSISLYEEYNKPITNQELISEYSSYNSIYFIDTLLSRYAQTLEGNRELSLEAMKCIIYRHIAIEKHSSTFGMRSQETLGAELKEAAKWRDKDNPPQIGFHDLLQGLMGRVQPTEAELIVLLEYAAESKRFNAIDLLLESYIAKHSVFEDVGTISRYAAKTVNLKVLKSLLTQDRNAVLRSVPQMSESWESAIRNHDVINVLNFVRALFTLPEPVEDEHKASLRAALVGFTAIQKEFYRVYFDWGHAKIKHRSFAHTVRGLFLHWETHLDFADYKDIVYESLCEIEKALNDEDIDKLFQTHIGDANIICKLIKKCPVESVKKHYMRILEMYSDNAQVIAALLECSPNPDQYREKDPLFAKVLSEERFLSSAVCVQALLTQENGPKLIFHLLDNSNGIFIQKVVDHTPQNPELRNLRYKAKVGYNYQEQENTLLYFCANKNVFARDDWSKQMCVALVENGHQLEYDEFASLNQHPNGHKLIEELTTVNADFVKQKPIVQEPEPPALLRQIYNVVVGDNDGVVVRDNDGVVRNNDLNETYTHMLFDILTSAAKIGACAAIIIYGVHKAYPILSKSFETYVEKRHR